RDPITLDCHTCIQRQTLGTKRPGVVFLRPTRVLGEKQTVAAQSLPTPLESLKHAAEIVVIPEPIEFREIDVRSAPIASNQEHVFIIFFRRSCAEVGGTRNYDRSVPEPIVQQKLGVDIADERI